MCAVFCGLQYILGCPQIRAITGDYGMKFGDLRGGGAEVEGPRFAPWWY